MNKKTLLAPCVYITHDDKNRRLNIEMELPGVEKKDIKLDMKKDGFCISAQRGEDAEYSGCFWLAHEVMPERVEAEYESGLLRIFAPMKEWEQNVPIPVK